jgi:thiol-disulfide isomerase/thioredoxin
MKLIFCFGAMLCLFFGVAAQERKGAVPRDAVSTAVLSPLKVGDYVPGVILDHVLNNNGHVLNISDLKGKLLIIDFWATSCSGCIMAMPRLDSLSAQFGDKLFILPVTPDSGIRVTQFQRTNKFLGGKKFLTVVEDKSLHSLFPHRLLPHEVWIDGKGKVLGISEVSDVTAANIELVLASKGVFFGTKQDNLAYDKHKPLLVAGNGGSDTIYRYRSVITGALAGLPSQMGFSYDTARRMTIVRATNVSVKRLYSLAYKGLRILPDELVDLGGVTGVYCYELDLPSASPALVRRSIREDLDRFFGMRSQFKGGSFSLLVPDDAAEDERPLTL